MRPSGGGTLADMRARHTALAGAGAAIVILAASACAGSGPASPTRPPAGVGARARVPVLGRGGGRRRLARLPRVDEPGGHLDDHAPGPRDGPRDPVAQAGRPGLRVPDRGPRADDRRHRAGHRVRVRSVVPAGVEAQPRVALARRAAAVRRHQPARHHRHAVYDAAANQVLVVAERGGSVRHELFALDATTGRVAWRKSVDLPGVSARDMQQRRAGDRGQPGLGALRRAGRRLRRLQGPAAGRSVGQVSVGVANRFATPALYGADVIVPTLAGIAVVRTS